MLAFFILALLLTGGGCASAGKGTESMQDAGIPGTAEEPGSEPQTEKAGDVRIKEFLISPGDEMKITVYQHEELTRSIKIPPDGIIFYPIVGDIDTRGKSLRELREMIAQGLSKYKEQALLPGDEISITVLREDAYNRKLIIPSDGSIFFPHIGFVNIERKSLRELTGLITEGLSRYLVDPQVMIDIVKLNNPARIADPQIGIEVAGFGGQKVFILGEVNRPGVFLADGHMQMIEAITLAGGATLDGKLNSVLLIRGGLNQPRPELQRLDLEKILEEGDLSQNPLLSKGDIVYVPRTFIANVDRFFEHLAKIVRPVVDIEVGYWIGQNIAVGPERSRRTAP